MRAALLLALAASALGHICILSPHQRGALNVTTPGDPSCYRRTDYCGGVALGAPLTTYVAGETITLTLQQVRALSCVFHAFACGVCGPCGKEGAGTGCLIVAVCGRASDMPFP